MEIKTLENTSIEEIVDALVESFKGYFVPIIADYNAWRLKLFTARLNKKLSVGTFDGDKLVAFILNCVDDDCGMNTAYNTGTGVIEAYRNQQLVDKMYDFIIPKLQESSINKLKLEVITENYRAIRVYERIGFKIVDKRKLISFSGNVDDITDENVLIKQISKDDFKNLERPKTYYSWDFREITLDLNENLKIFKVEKDDHYKGYFIINSTNNTITQLETQNEDWNLIFNGIKKFSEEIRIINIDENRKSLIEFCVKIGLKNMVNQYEMEKIL